MATSRVQDSINNYSGQRRSDLCRSAVIANSKGKGVARPGTKGRGEFINLDAGRREARQVTESRTLSRLEEWIARSGIAKGLQEAGQAFLISSSPVYRIATLAVLGQAKAVTWRCLLHLPLPQADSPSYREHVLSAWEGNPHFLHHPVGDKPATGEAGAGEQK